MLGFAPNKMVTFLPTLNMGGGGGGGGGGHKSMLFPK